jgi:hypothetical protein
LKNSPCGKTYSANNGIIDFNLQITTSIDCLILIEANDGQNIFLRLDYLDWDKQENSLDIGLFDNPNRYRIFQISGKTFSFF